ncbi:MAG: hypothetical protein QM582_17535 [Micropruina sp.]|uniref:hypothetical protein n=1 Tax=Micropruina sp. TaxID=2737536 RepID=UPI0039E2AB97
MPIDAALAAAVLTAVIAAFAALWTSWRQVRNQRELLQVTQAEQKRQALTDRCSTYLAATQHAVLQLRDVAMADMESKDEADREKVWPTVDRVNTALVAIKLNDPDELVEAARQLDDAMVELLRAARDQQYTQAEWRARRNEIIGKKPELVVQAARAQALKLQVPPALRPRNRA